MNIFTNPEQSPKTGLSQRQGCISCGTCSYPELTEDHVLTSAYVKVFRIVTRNAANKSFWRKKDCSWPPLNKYAMNIWWSSLRIRAHLSWRTGKHFHVFHVFRTYSMCSYPRYQDTTTYAALPTTGMTDRPPAVLKKVRHSDWHIQKDILLRDVTHLVESIGGGKVWLNRSTWRSLSWTAWTQLQSNMFHVFESKQQKKTTPVEGES